MKSFFTIGLLTFFSATLFAGDWPMWRYDAARSGTSPDGIAENPVLLWSRKLTPVRPAWPLEEKKRLDFDAAYEPIVMGKLLFIASPNNGAVTAYDTETGAERWKYFTEGPVRCAPACWSSPGGSATGGKDKIFFGSDDGCLYCLDAQTGKLVWKFRGAPADRPDRRQLGNGHLVSFWPVRGGPVVKDGIVYFGAGIWPTFGIFIYALDAETGKVKWLNKDLNYIADVSFDHNLHTESGLSPQGHFVIAGDKLLVPNGRAMPAGLDRATGKLIYYAQGCRNGDSRVAAHGDYGFVGKTGVINLYDFREVGSKWAGQGDKPPEGYSFENWKRLDLQESTRPPYKFVDACDSSSAFKNGVAYGVENGTFHAYDVTNPKIGESEYQFYDVKLKPITWEPPLLWQFKTQLNGPSCAVIMAGSRIYGSAKNKIIALNDIDGKQQVAWNKDVNGTPSSMATADSKLFVATREGWIYCFGEGLPGKTYDEKPLALESKTDGWKEKTEKILKATGIKSGYGLVLGLNDGRLVEEILKQTDMTVLAVDTEPAKIEAMKIRFDKAGLLGLRVELFNGNPFEFPFPPYIASLIVSENHVFPGQLKKTDMGKLFNTLLPYGGTLCFEMPAKENAELGEIVKSANLAKAVLKREGDLALLLRDGALPGSASWTHHKCDAAGTSCSQDDLVRAPLGCLWYGDIPGAPAAFKKAGDGGRVYGLDQQNRCGILSAYDAYTGRFLWKNQIEGGLVHFAAMSDAIYAAGDGKCFVYDPETGKLINTFAFDNGSAAHVRDIRVGEGIVLLACSDQKSTWHTALAEGMLANTLICLDRRSGAELWRRAATNNSFNIDALALGADDMVFCIDHNAFSPSWIDRQRAGKSTRAESALLALEARTGKVVWSKNKSYDLPDRHSKGGMGLANDWIAYSPENGILVNGRFKLATGQEAKSGKTLWEDKAVFPSIYNPVILYYRPTPLFVQDGHICFSDGSVYDMLTGNAAKPIFRREAHGCNSAVASVRLVMLRDSTVSYTDIANGKIYHMRNVRSGCFNTMIATDGVLNVLRGGCADCNYPVQTSFAMVYMPEVAAWSGTTPLKMTPPPPRSAPQPKPNPK